MPPRKQDKTTKPSRAQAALIKKLFTAGYSKMNIRQILSTTPIREKWRGPELDKPSISAITDRLEKKNPKIKIYIWMGKGKRRKSKTVQMLELRKQKLEMMRRYRISNKARTAGFLYRHTSALTKEGLLARKQYRQTWLDERKRHDTDRKY
jgi:hypothetical protein